MARTKSAEAVKFMLRVPPALMKRLQKQAEQNNTSVTQEIINQLENHDARAIERAVVLMKPMAEGAASIAAKVAATVVLAALKDAARPPESEVERRLGQLQEALARADEVAKRAGEPDEGEK
jgi:sugar phosphate isomerase/epimerase